jgi:hypothetical protein
MSREFIKIDKKVGLNPRERDVFKYAAYFECERFNYTYSSAVNSYNYAHNGSSTNSHLSGKVVSEDVWNSIVTQLRNLVTDKYIPMIQVQIFCWSYDPNGVGHFESGFVFRYGDDIIAYSVWDFVNKSGVYVTRLTDDGYMI